MYSELLNLHSKDISSEAEVETRFLAKLFEILNYSDSHVIPKGRLESLEIHDGSKKTKKEVDFILTDLDNNPRIIVEAKDPQITLPTAWGQAASYALSYNRDKKDDQKICWLLLSNGFITSLYRIDSDTPIVTLKLSDFVSGSPAYVNLRKHTKIEALTPNPPCQTDSFIELSHKELNNIFSDAHDLIWKKEKLNPTDAFFEFCKFIFLKLREDKKREQGEYVKFSEYQIPLTSAWLDAQITSSKHPVRDILFKDLKDELEIAIQNNQKKRIFESEEEFKLSATTTKELISIFERINLSSIDEDLNGRMFEVFLNAVVRGKSLGQYFTPRSIVDFMTRIALSETDVKNPPNIIDASSGTAGFLIEALAYLGSKIRADQRFTNSEKDDLFLKVCNESLYGIEASERIARIARINMYLHGDGGSHIFYGDGLVSKPTVESDMTNERKNEIIEHERKIEAEKFDIVLSNPPFSMTYSEKVKDEKVILEQREIANGKASAKSNMLFLDRYFEILKKGGEMLIVLDDTILNGETNVEVRKWILERFIIVGVHSLPFNAFFKAKANIKTSILHLRKKVSPSEEQSHIFMSISNNIGHDNALRDTPNRDNLPDILSYYFEWQRTGSMETVIKNNQNINENLECPEQIWILQPDMLKVERFDSFYYAPELTRIRNELKEKANAGEISLLLGSELNQVKKISKDEKNQLKKDGLQYKYIEIGDVTKYGLIAKYVEATFDKLPTRAEYQIKKNDVLFALNNSSRGTTLIVPELLNNQFCTSGFFVIRPTNQQETYLYWQALRSEYVRQQIYYLAQTASQPELKQNTWDTEFIVPYPEGENAKKLESDAIDAQKKIDSLLNLDNSRMGNSI